MNETDYKSGRSVHCGRDRQGCERLVSLVPKITSRKKITYKYLHGLAGGRKIKIQNILSQQLQKDKK